VGEGGSEPRCGAVRGGESCVTESGGRGSRHVAVAEEEASVEAATEETDVERRR
jgi:hypothetical protein